jgi:hypothetical protein
VVVVDLMGLVRGRQAWSMGMMRALAWLGSSTLTATAGLRARLWLHRFLGPPLPTLEMLPQLCRIYSLSLPVPCTQLCKAGLRCVGPPAPDFTEL